MIPRKPISGVVITDMPNQSQKFRFWFCAPFPTRKLRNRLTATLMSQPMPLQYASRRLRIKCVSGQGRQMYLVVQSRTHPRSPEAAGHRRGLVGRCRRR